MEFEDELFIDDDLDIIDIINFGFPRRAYERSDYFVTMDNFSFFRRFRLTKSTALSFQENIQEEIEFQNDLNNSLTPMNQLLATLRLYPCAAHQITIGDFIGCHQTTISRILKRVTTATARTRPNYIMMIQSEQEILRTATDFYVSHRFQR
nr:unnamed protein product [Callosobruchus analis]